MKKAMQLSQLSGAHIMLEIYNSEDKSSLKYISETSTQKSEPVQEATFTNSNFKLVEYLDLMLTKHGYIKDLFKGEAEYRDQFEAIDGKNMYAMFSLANKL